MFKYLRKKKKNIRSKTYECSGTKTKRHFDKHIDDLRKALPHATDKLNKSNVEKMDLQQLADSYIVQEELTEKLKYMRLDMEKVQDQINKPKLTSAQVDKQKM